MWCFNLYVGPQRDLGVLCATNVTSHATHQHATTFCFFKTSGLRFKQTDKVHLKKEEISTIIVKIGKWTFSYFPKNTQAFIFSASVHIFS